MFAFIGFLIVVFVTAFVTVLGCMASTGEKACKLMRMLPEGDAEKVAGVFKDHLTVLGQFRKWSKK